MATVIRERERIQATPNGLVRDRYADPTMTRAAREKRIAWRLDHLDEWQRDLEDLAHYDPRYAYDVAHEYDHDWTTDPDYGPRAIDLLEFDEDGVQHREDTRPQAIELHMRDTLQDRFGHRVVYQNRYGFVEEIAENLGLLTRQGRPSNTIKPDLMVMPSEEELLGDQDPDRRPRPDDPVPELVLEILSESTAARDLGDKRLLYEALGVHEYLVYDLGDKRRPGSPRELLLYRLEGGIYRQMAPEPKRSASDPDRHWSDVFGTYIRFLPDVRENAEEFRKLPEGNRPPPASSGGIPRSLVGATMKPMPKSNGTGLCRNETGLCRNETGLCRKMTGSPRNGTKQSRNKIGSLRKGQAWPSTCCARIWGRNWRQHTGIESRQSGTGTVHRRMWSTASCRCGRHPTRGSRCYYRTNLTTTPVLPSPTPDGGTPRDWQRGLSPRGELPSPTLRRQRPTTNRCAQWMSHSLPRVGGHPPSSVVAF